LNRVCELLKESGLNHVVDMGCGTGKLISRLRRFRQFQRIQAVDVSYQALLMAREKMRAEDARVEFLHGSLLYRDSRLQGCQAVALVEVIEHLDLPRLRACEKNLFGFLRPQLVVLTTPNRDYNVLFESLSAGSFRHHDHRFEWTREEFREWGLRVAGAHGYRVEFEDLGDVHPEHGAPSQMGVFRR
ncbi:MAG: methyltransferase domain-containing protein, partial [Candidatus Eremiobacteraeota bacterium]|nr:methyltransferase domain-containing protein [Candidatus Eremiobacteraeota bacterium]